MNTENKFQEELEIPNHLPPNMKLVFVERQEVQEKIKTLCIEHLKGFPGFSVVEAGLIESQLIHLGRLRDTLDDQLKLYDHLK